MKQPIVSISTETFLRIVLLIVLCALLYVIRDTVVLVLVALLLSTILDPAADWFQKKHLPRALTVIGIYILALGTLLALGFILAPLLVQELSQMAQNFSGYWDQAIGLLPTNFGEQIKLAVQSNLNTIASVAQGGISTAVTSVIGVFGTIGSIIIVLVLSFYLVVEEEAARRTVAAFTPPKHKKLVHEVFSKIQERLGGWARGQLLISLIIGALVFVALLIIGVPYAFALGIMAAVIDFIPYFGPIISGAFGVFFALAVSPTHALVALVVYYGVHLIESNLLIPKIMEKTVGLNPVISILSVLICFELFGVLGVFLAIPIAIVIVAVVEAILDRQSKEI